MALLEELDSAPGADKFPDMYTKLNEAIQTINSILGGGTEKQIISKVSGTDFDFEFIDNPTRTKIVDIGVWNMNQAPTIDVAHGVAGDITNIVSVQVLIHNDALTTSYDLNYAGYFSFDGTEITLRRTTSGFFDSTSYEDEVMNRGTILIEYTV